MSKLFNDYKYRAKKRDIDFKITEDQFTYISTGQCYYCGIAFDKKIKEETCNGVDKFYNDKGYSEDNCVPACWICNRAKSDLSPEEFFTWIKRLMTQHKHMLDPDLTLDDRNKIVLDNAAKSHAYDIKSYEDDALKRAKACLEQLNFFPKNIIQKILIVSSRNDIHKERLVKFVYSVDVLSMPKSTQQILDTKGTPEYLKQFDTGNKVLTSEISDILCGLRLNTKELKSLRKYSKTV